PSTNLEVNAPAIALDDEYLLKLGVSDAANDHLTFLNGTTANGAFAPTIWGNYDFDNQRAGLTLFSNITADTGTNPVMKFDAWSNLSGGPTTRPAFEFMSGGNQILTMDADKQVGIGTQSPSKLLEIFSQVATTDQFRLTYSSGVYTDLYTDASGNLTINPTGTNVTFGATSNPISLIPAENNTAGYTVGTSANRWKSGYFVDGIVTGASSTTYAESGITSTYAGALGITPASGQNLNISLATTGDFAVNTNQLYVDTSAGNVGIGTTAPGATLDVVYSDSTTTGNTTYGSTISATQSGVVTSGTDIIYGLDVTSSSTPAHSTGGNINVYGGRFTATGGDYGGSAGAIGLLGVASGAKSSNRGLFGQVTIGVEDADNTGVYGYVTGTHPGTSTTGFNYSFYGNNNAIYTGTSSVPKKYGIYSILGGEWDGSSYGGSFNNNSNNLNTTSTTNKYGIFVSTAGTSYANNSYGARIENVVINSGRDSTNKYGLYITSTGTYPGLTTTDTNNYGLYVDTPTGAVNNYAAVFAGGNVGIGTTSPSYQLQLSTDSAAKPTSNTWTVVSDSRLKENITPFTDGLSVINQINPVNYALNGHANMPAGDEGIGVIAQEIMGIAPYTVGTFEAKYNPDDETTQTFYSFDSSALTFVLINAVKELAVRLPAEPVNTASQMPTGSATLTALTMDGMIYMHGNDIVNIGRLAGLNNHWSIEPDGTIKTDKLLKTVITSYQNEMVETTAVTSTDTVITLSGSSELQNGQATITFEDIKAEFNDITSTTAPIYVVVTPNGPASLYVSSKDHNGFTVEQINGNDSGITFDWLVTAYRKDYEPVEQEPLVIDPPPTDPDPIATTDLVIIDPPPTDPDPIATTDIIDPIVIQDPLEEPPV
ncbi:tail fiber domain-containing protein, partial [Patescibacteria group bacterium]|nr:tail fiber domain-containing protein [Patescibacteria group bacterium]